MALRIGIVDLCTSHPASFVPILRELGCEIMSVWDGGEARPRGYASSFAKEFAIPHVCSRLEDMIGRVDAVTLHAANWDRHIEQVRLFVEAGIAVCVDKPVVGCLDDIEALLTLNRVHSGLIFGGSSCQFAHETIAMRERIAASGPVVSALAMGHADLFSYGIHTIELAQAVLGYDAAQVMCLTESPLGSYWVRFQRGFDLNLQMYNPAPGWFLMVNGFESGAMATTIDTSQLYRPFLERFLQFAQGAGEGWSLEDALQPIRVALAMERSHEQPGEWVDIDDASLRGVHFDGADFARSYREARDSGTSVYLDLKEQRWNSVMSLAV